MDIRDPSEKLDGLGKWNKTHLNQCHLCFSQTNLKKDTCTNGLLLGPPVERLEKRVPTLFFLPSPKKRVKGHYWGT